MFILSKLKQTNSFFRFLLVGIVNTMVGLSTMLTLINFGNVSYWKATFIGNTIGATVSYFLNRTFTFNSKVTAITGVPRFIVIIFLCYVFSFSISGEMARIVGATGFVSEDELAVLGGTVLYTVTNYIGQKSFVFHKLSKNRV
ncbi:GtrA family protein [Bacillus sp. B15-48]|uniref:GtrA family protein n=1 Tax=Bacillus sp. B15-48 TaxID=1548601 RepID=UPI00193EF23D|nr:GtrA family protein [Bacillus sp. B15-48]MBM4762792.1 GtrA family protein [Bacillus sp. B15-48]